MKQKRREIPPDVVRERTVGEEQWVRGSPPTLREAMGVAFVWLAVTYGAFLLFLGGANLWLVHEPVRGWPFFSRTLVLVVSLVVVIVVTARPLARAWRRGGRTLRLSLAGLLAAVAVASTLAFASTVREVPAGPRLLEVGGRFAFGPYPDERTIARLSAEGFHGVVSILEGEGDAREAGLLARERAAAERVGLELVSVPLFSRGEMDMGSLERLSRLAKEGGGTYYVHGLTGDSRRLDLVRRLLLRMGGRRDVVGLRLTDGLALERGPVYQLDARVFLMPFPTDAELLEYLAASPVRTVVVLLDPADPDDLAWIEHERRVLEVVEVDVEAAPLHPEPFDPGAALEVSERARERDHPVVVQTFLTPSVTADAIRMAYESGRPPLPPGVFQDTLSGGGVTVVAPHVAMGPRPVGREFGWLYVRGVRKIALFDGSGMSARSVDRRLSDVAGLEWYFLDGDEERLLAELARGGPWYVYGATGREVVARITERFGSPLRGEGERMNGETEREQE